MNTTLLNLKPGCWKASEVVINNAPTRLLLLESQWGGATVADLGDAATANLAHATILEAAPDLLLALEGLRHAVEHEGAHGRMVQAVIHARAAIAKATRQRTRIIKAGQAVQQDGERGTVVDVYEEYYHRVGDLATVVSIEWADGATSQHLLDSFAQYQQGGTIHLC